MKDIVYVTAFVMLYMFIVTLAFKIGDLQEPTKQSSATYIIPDVRITVTGPAEQRVEVSVGHGGRLIPVTPLDIETTTTKTFLEERQKEED